MTVPQKGKVFSPEFLQGETFLQSPVAIAKGCFGFLSPFKYTGFPSGSAIKNSLANAGHSGLMPGLGRSFGEGKGYPLQNSGLEIPWIVDLGVTKSQT